MVVSFSNWLRNGRAHIDELRALLAGIARGQEDVHPISAELIPLEPRILLSASPAAAVVEPAADPVAAEPQFDAVSESDAIDVSVLTTVANTTVEPFEMPQAEFDTLFAELGTVAESDASTPRRELVFVDPSADDFEQLLDGLRQDDSVEFEVVLLDGRLDGVEQISAELARRTDVDAVHVVSHAADGRIKLGNSWLTNDAMSYYGELISAWSSSLSEDADLLIYGCNLAESQTGQELLEQLHQRTGADVAASTDLTGHASLGGDWDLEFGIGVIDTQIAIRQELHQSWHNVLAVITVTTTVDEDNGDTSNIVNLLLTPGGTGISLREAILAANLTPNVGGPDEIHFDIPDSDPGHFYYADDSTPDALLSVATTGVADGLIGDFDPDYPYAQHSWFSIDLNTALPRLDITDAVLIDGYTQAGASANTLAIGHDASLRIELTSTGADGNRGITVLDGGDGSTIRGLAINGFDGAEIMVEPGADGVTIQGNFIGTDITGTMGRGGGDAAVHLRAGNSLIGGPDVADRNILSGNNSRGVATFTFGPIETGNVIQNNYIGTDVTGLSAVANGSAGIQIYNQNGMQILDNVISGNSGEGIWFRDIAPTNMNTVIRGNLIGVGADGTTVVANTANGILADGPANSATIGGTGAGERNVISGNAGDGIRLDGNTATDISILGNSIGTDAGGTLNLGNAGHGILLKSGTSDNFLGGILPGEGNMIAFNGGSGVAITQNGSDRNAIRGNAIYSNTGLGIDLNDDGVTANDTGDGDSNENNLQNHPVLATAELYGADLLVAGTLQSTGAETFDIDIYASVTDDGSGHGEAERYLGSTTVSTDSNGYGVFTLTLTGSGVVAGEYITATATDATGNTSEFSLNMIAGTTTLAQVDEFRVNTETTNTQETSAQGRGSHRAVAMAPNGNYVIVWSSFDQDGDGWGVYAQLFDRNGVPRSGEIHVTDQNTVNDQVWATVGMDDAGGFVVAWTSDHSGGDDDIYARRFDADGNALGGRFQANDGSSNEHRSPSIDMAGNGEFVISWKERSGGDSGDIFVRRFNADGSDRDVSDIAVATGPGSQSDAALAMNNSGEFVVIWDEFGGVFAQRFNSDGTTNGGQIAVDGSSSAGNGSVAIHEDGSFVVVWREGSSGARDVYLRRYNSLGVDQGPAELVAITSANSQTLPSIAMDRDGNFIVAWEGDGALAANTDDSGVFFQKYDASGNRVGGETLINQTRLGTQDQVSIATLDLTNFVAVWSGNGDQPGHVDGSGVFARQFDGTNLSPGAAHTSPYIISEGDSVTLDASTSYDPDGDTLSYNWDLDNDGSFDDATGATLPLSWLALQTLGFIDDGVYDIGVQVDDGNGNSDSVYTTLTINDTSPTMIVTGSATATENVLYDLTLGATDPGDDTVSSWRVDWGDGTTSTHNFAAGTAQHEYTIGGTFSILVTAVDEHGSHVDRDLIVPSFERTGAPDDDTIGFYDAATGSLTGTFTSAGGVLDGAYAAAVGVNGDIYVTGFDSDNVVRYSSTGVFIGEFAGTNLNGPTGLAFGSDGHLYVSSYHSNSVERFDATGAHAGTAVSGGGLNGPSGLVFGQDGDLYVTSWNNGQIRRYDGINGAYMGQYGSEGGSGPDQIAFDSTGSLAITQTFDDEVVFYDGSTFHTSIAVSGPTGVALSPEDHVYIASDSANAVYVHDGTTLTQLFTVSDPYHLTFTPDQLVTVTNQADEPAVTATTTDEDTQSSSGLVISRSGDDGLEVTHYKITGITNGTLYLNDGTTQVSNGDFITADDGAAGLKFTPTGDYHGSATFNVQASTTGDDTDLSSSVAASITIDPVADLPVVPTGSSTPEDVELTGIVIDRATQDGVEVTHFQVTGITNGTLRRNDNSLISNGDFLTHAEAQAGLKFLPALNFYGTATFDVQGSLNATTGGLGGSRATVSIDVLSDNDAPTITAIGNQTVPEDGSSGALAFTVADVESTAGALTVTASSSNTTLIPNGNLALVDLGGGNWTIEATGALHQFGGPVTITVTVDDGTTTTDETFDVTITAVNDAPTISTIADQTINEDTSTGALAFSVGDVETAAGSLTVTAVSGNTTVIPNGNLTLVDLGAGSWTIEATPDANQNGGPVTITVTVDDGTTTTNETFDVTITPQNDVPTITAISDQTINEDTSTGALAFSVGDVETAAGALTVTAVSGNTTLIPNGNLSLVDLGSGNWTIEATPAANQNGGPVTITVTVDDGTSTTDESFDVTITAVNDAPTISAIADQTINEDTSTGALAFRIGDVETAAGALTVTAGSSNTTLIPNGNVSLVDLGSGNWTIEATPAANQIGGPVTITVTVDDGTTTTDETFDVTVTAVNDVPTITAIADQTINEDTSTGSLAFSVGDVETAAGSLTVTASSSNATVIPNANLTLVDLGGGNWTIDATPAANRNGGPVTITVTVDDGSSTTDETFDVTITAVNDDPTISAIADQTINEDTSTGALAFSVGDVETAAGSLTVTAVSSNTTLIPNGNLTLVDLGGGNWTIEAMPAANQNGGPVTITVTVDDGTSTIDETFDVTVTAVNDAPTITAISDQSIPEEGSTGALAFGVGDVETAAGSLTVTASSSNTTLIPNGNLTLVNLGSGNWTIEATPAANQNGGPVTITVTVDDGTTTTDGTFDVTITPQNDAPTISAIADQTINEDTSTGALTFSVGDVETAAVSLTVTAVSGNTTLIPNGNLSLVDLGGGNWTIEATPAANQNGGPVTITVTVDDGTTTTDETFDVTITAVNDDPTISAIADQTINEDTSTGALAFNVGDVETAAGSLTVTAVSGNTTLIPNGNLTLVDLGAGNWTIEATPAANQNGGPVTITVTVDDGTSTTDATFDVTITAINDAPTVTVIADQTINEDTSTGALAFSVGDVETAAGSLTVTASSSNTTLVPNGNLTLVDLGSGNWTIEATPAANQNGGPVTITVTVDDGTTTTDETFDVTITAVNDAPTISTIADQTINEDTSTGALAFSVGDVETAAGSLTVSASSSNTTVIPNGNLTLVDLGSGNWTIEATPAANQNGGPVTITVTVNDGTSTTDETFDVTISAVNDAPTISAIADQTINEDTPTGTLAFNVGDVETAVGSLTVTATSSNTTVIPNGTLSLVDLGGGNWTIEANPGVNQNGGPVTITVTVDDGVTTTDEVFNVMVTPDNDSPTISAISDQVINEDTVLGPLSFVVGDVESPDGRLVVTAVSDNQSLIRNSDIQLGGSGANRTLTLRPVLNAFGGPVTVTLTVSDGTVSVQSTFGVTIRPQNDDPLANSESHEITQDVGQATLDGDLLRLVSDVDSSSFTFVISSAPSDGVVVAQANGEFTYVSNVGFVGTDTFEYTVRDDAGGEATGTITIRVLAGTVVPPPTPPTPADEPEPADEPDNPETPAADESPEPETPAADSTPQSGPPESAASTPEDANEIAALVPPPEKEDLDWGVDRDTGLDDPQRYLNVVNASDRSSVVRELRGELVSVFEPVYSVFEVIAFQSSLWDELDQRDKTRSEDLAAMTLMVGGSSVVATGFSVGYVIWLLRGTALLSGILAQLPAWRLMDPLVVLQYAKGNEEEGESLEQIVDHDLDKTRPDDSRHVNDHTPETEPAE